MEKRFASIGWTVTRHEVGEKWGPGLVITNFKDQSAYDVVICAHMDTVQPVGNAAKHPLTVEGTIARGAGAGDDQGFAQRRLVHLQGAAEGRDGEASHVRPSFAGRRSRSRGTQ